MNNIPDRILIAEDHGSTRHFLQRLIESWGFEVIAVEDGEAALKILLSEDSPPLAIVDWIMPKFNGTEVCAAVRQSAIQPYIYIMLLTAQSKKNDITAGLEAGADDYVSKPFDGEELRARIRAGQRVVKLERTLHRRVEELQNALADVKKLKQLLPISCFAKGYVTTAIIGVRSRSIFTLRQALISPTVCVPIVGRNGKRALVSSRERNGRGQDFDHHYSGLCHYGPIATKRRARGQNGPIPFLK